MDVREGTRRMRGASIPAPLEGDGESLLLMYLPQPAPASASAAMMPTPPPSLEDFKALGEDVKPLWPSKEFLRQMLVAIAPTGSILPTV